MTRSNEHTNLSVYWDADPLEGLGKSVVFVRGLVLLRLKRSIEIGGFYAQRWPRHLEERMGLKPVNKQTAPGNYWEGELRGYHRGTEYLNP